MSFRSFLSAAVAVLVLSSCASGGGGSAPAADATPAPAGSALAKVQPGMSDEEVRSLLGSPDDSKNYMTGKAFIPFYFGPDTHRSDWVYHGQGTVVFRRNRYSGGLEVIHTAYEPSTGSE
jgi:hypothetical protein